MGIIWIFILIGIYLYCFYQMYKAKIKEEIERELEEKYGRSLRGY